jgi:phosphogluconate dehydratase
VLRTVDAPFAKDGGLRVLQGNLGRAVMKVSAINDDAWCVRAPARVLSAHDDVAAAFDAGELSGDVFAVLIGQGPQTNGMPKLHRLTPLSSILQGRGRKVALVTDGRMFGASGKIPTAIEVTPQSAAGGRLGRLRGGDLMTLDAHLGVLEVALDEATLDARPQARTATPGMCYGRGLFAGMRACVSSAEQGAMTST